MGLNTIPVPAGAITAGNVSLIASGSLSGSSLTLSGLSSYQILNLQIWGPQQGPDYPNTSWYWYLNGDTSSVYQALAGGIDPAGTTYPTGNGGATSGNISAQGPFSVNGYNARFFELSLSNCKTLGYTTFDVFGFFQTSASNAAHNQSSGAYKVNSTISSITFSSASGSSITLGTYTLYGA